MKLATIINSWADTVELLPSCIENHLEFADSVIVVWSKKSNRGQVDDAVFNMIATTSFRDTIFHQYEPNESLAPHLSETKKRNLGLDIAREHEFTHFLIADADEFYVAKEVIAEKERFNNPIIGLVCGLQVYVKSPCLYTSDSTLIPFIHKLSNKMKCGAYRHYPFSHEGKTAMIDPSRRLSINTGVHWSALKMHHMSYVRKNIDLKINNSSANLKRSADVIRRDMANAKPGYISEMYGRSLKECDNQFNIPLWDT